MIHSNLLGTPTENSQKIHRKTSVTESYFSKVAPSRPATLLKCWNRTLQLVASCEYLIKFPQQFLYLQNIYPFYLLEGFQILSIVTLRVILTTAAIWHTLNRL